jgi:hypothetical protein
VEFALIKGVPQCLIPNEARFFAMGGQVTQDRLTSWLKLLRGQKGPLAASFVSLSTFLVVFGYVRGYGPAQVFPALLASLSISLCALCIRWLEKRCPAPLPDETHRSVSDAADPNTQ